MNRCPVVFEGRKIYVTTPRSSGAHPVSIRRLKDLRLSCFEPIDLREQVNNEGFSPIFAA